MFGTPRGRFFGLLQFIVWTFVGVYCWWFCARSSLGAIFYRGIVVRTAVSKQPMVKLSDKKIVPLTTIDSRLTGRTRGHSAHSSTTVQARRAEPPPDMTSTTSSCTVIP